MIFFLNPIYDPKISRDYVDPQGNSQGFSQHLPKYDKILSLSLIYLFAVHICPMRV